jgi:flagellar hook-associated protein 2
LVRWLLDLDAEDLMGTVGISFGSPTSGAGFDVSSTVAQIVGNLQNVETPWKSQLTSLEAQDTTISSLGTLFSNLSNDMSSLTDLQGILAEKTGSSSDTNVLQITAATSSAIAGTHTVEVSNLASTSSGYLAAVTSASATLTGSVTLQSGDGSAVEISVPTASGQNTLAGLAGAINSSAVGITASVLTDANGSRLSLISSTSGAGGDITVSNNGIAATGQILGYTGTAGTNSAASTGTLAGIETAGDTLSGSISIQVGTGTATIIAVGTSSNTLATLATAINTAALGVTASVVTSNGTSSLSLLSGATGAAGNLTVNSSIVDSNSSTLGYNNTVTGANANLTVDGINLTSASNTVTNLIPGITLQLLAPSTGESDGSLEQVQVVIGNDNTNVESTVNQFVSDYNAAVSAMNTQDGNTSSGTPEPLFGSPTLSLLQQQLLGGLNVQNPNGNLTSVAANSNTTLTGSMTIAVAGGIPVSTTGTEGTGSAASTSTLTTANAADSLTGSISIQVGSGTAETVVLGAVPSSGAATDTIYTGTNVNTLSTLASTLTANATTLGITANLVGNALTLTSSTTGTAGALTVNSNVLDTSPQTIDVPTASGNNTLSGLAAAINAANIGVTAGVATISGQSSLTLTSGTEGSTGALTVNSSVVATSDIAMTYSGTNGVDATTGTTATYATGTITSIPSAGDTLAGSLTIEAGSGATTEFELSTLATPTLTGLSNAINNANIGITASIVTANGKSSLSLTSQTAGTGGNLTVAANLLDTTNPTGTTLSYTNSSDITSLTSLGISVNNDGTIALDASSLDSVLNADYTGVVGFFQNSNSWGQSFSTMLSNAGTSSPTGILSLATSSNSSIESTLNADISRENTLISSQQTSLTAELNSANEIMQELPSQLQGVNELYSAITGYNQQTNG